MPNYSSKTDVVACRVDIEVYNILKRRAGKRGLKVNNYVRKLIEYDALRKR